MKNFLSLTAILEGTTGFVLIVVPQFIVPLLLSTPLEEKGGIISARIAGVAIVFLALNCWFSRKEKNNSSMLNSLLFYNFAIVAIFTYSSLAYELSNPFMWLVVIAHIGLSLWGILLMGRKSV